VIPQEATARAILPCDLNLERMQFQRNVFPVPPKPGKGDRV